MTVVVQNAGNNMMSNKVYYYAINRGQNYELNLTLNSTLTKRKVLYPLQQFKYQPFLPIVCADIKSSARNYFGRRSCTWKGYGYELSEGSDNSYTCPVCQKKIF